MSAHFERLVVFGPGLLGGSLLLAARQRRAARQVVAVTRSEETARGLLDAGLTDEALTRAEPALKGADLVMLCTPLHAMAGILRHAAPHLEAGCIVSDVGSVKGPLAETLPGLLPGHARYVGSHPMAGSHEQGFAFARADLFEDAVCVVTPGEGVAGDEASARVAAFWRALGAKVVTRRPVEHDAQAAWISHAPHALAYAFAAALDGAPDGAAALAGPGFRDFTRIAGSDPEMWADILISNRKALGAPLARALETFEALARSVEAGDAEAVRQILAQGNKALAQMAASADAPATASREVETDFEISTRRRAFSREGEG